VLALRRFNKGERKMSQKDETKDKSETSQLADLPVTTVAAEEPKGGSQTFNPYGGFIGGVRVATGD
jgi:hypothetical protein